MSLTKPQTINFADFYAEGIKMGEFQNRFTHADLVAATQESVDYYLALIADATDDYVTFEPEDPDANDTFAENPEDVHRAWTLGHVIVHTSASAEEAAALGTWLARGVEVNGRSRYEVPWQSVTTKAQLVQRLEESRRMRLAYLNAWPDEPHLDLLFTKLEARLGAINAIGYTMGGLKHDWDHYDQVAEIMRQAREALS